MNDVEREDWRRALAAPVTARPWRCFGELLDSPEFREAAAAEFPVSADLPPPEASRREFLALLGASFALAGLSGCTRAPREDIIPYASQPPEVTPGVATHYATAMSLDGYATGLIVESREGRPTKVEGNPSHPSSLGASGAIEQASVLSLYDPARARGVREGSAARSFRDFVAGFAPGGGLSAGLGDGEGLHVLMEPTSSPTTIAWLERLSATYPRASVHFFTPLDRDAAFRGAERVFGRSLETHADLSRADLVVALDADLLAEGPSWLRQARHFAERRRVRSTSDTMNRLYVVEAALSVTGGMADHRLSVRRSDVAPIAAALLAEVAAKSSHLPAPLLAKLRSGGQHSAWLRALGKDLLAHAGKSVVVVGDAQPPVVHALAHLINDALGNVGTTVSFTEPVIHQAGGQSHGLSRLSAALDDKSVETLLILGGNPVYSTPADLELGRRIRLAKRRVYLGLYENETAKLCQWFVPQTHYLEAWGDARADDGTASIVQPLIAPLFGGKTSDELLAVVARGARPRAYDLVRERWRAESSRDFETLWQKALQTGVLAGTASPEVAVRASWDGAAAWLDGLTPSPPGLEISFSSDSRVRAGAFTNNAWLLELPDPITKLTWDNALLVSPALAAKLELASEDVVLVKLGGRSVVAPVFVSPGQADGSVSLALGYGRSGAEALACDLGVNAFTLQSARAPRFEVGVTLERREGKHRLASTQAHWSTAGRDMIRGASLEEYKKTPRFAQRAHAKTALYKLPLLGAQQWGMSIDLNACTGCSACVVACQAENNSPVVGKEGVLMHREMHWLRIDRYFEGKLEAPSLRVQPMLCQHCEKAPCEYVCPVNATVHSPDGLNEQVYNRCVGTRFCSNNCAWKVRRFNWFNYHELAVRHAGTDARELQKMLMNPDVTVRARGVMEKCTYCVQRIRRTEISAKISGEALTDGDVVTACQQACPSRAITFGSLTIPGAEVKRLRDNERDYAVLEELGTEPRTRYLARLENPNPELPR